LHIAIINGLQVSPNINNHLTKLVFHWTSLCEHTIACSATSAACHRQLEPSDC